MHLGSPLTTLVGRIEGALLQVLSRTYTALNGRQIYRLAGAGSPAGVNKALARLVRTGLITASVQSHATLYRLNRDHVLWPAIESALTAVGELRKRIRQYAIDHGPNGATVVLYGSVESGEATADSDVDLLVVVPDATSDAATEDFVFELGEQIRAWTGNPAQIIHMSESELHESSNKADALVDTWLAQGEVLVGQALSADA